MTKLIKPHSRTRRLYRWFICGIWILNVIYLLTAAYAGNAKHTLLALSLFVVASFLAARQIETDSKEEPLP